MIELIALMMLGPISKWEDKQPDHRYVSAVSLGDAERCLIDADGWPVPMVYKQADRPNAAMFVYTAMSGTIGGRIDLIQKDDGLHVVAWNGPKQITKCAPPK